MTRWFRVYDDAVNELNDEAALDAWDAYGRATTGKPYPRNRRGGWCFPAKYPPIHSVKERTA
jgi:hypothetical protein